MDLTRVSTVPLARLASRSQSRNTCPFWKPQTDASGSSRAWCYLRSRPEGRCGGVGGENPPSRHPQRRAHFPERHRLVPGGASAPSARMAVGTGAGGSPRPGRASSSRGIGRQRSLLPRSLRPPPAPRPPCRRRRGAGPGPARRPSAGPGSSAGTWRGGPPDPRVRGPGGGCRLETMDGTRLQSRCRLGPGAPGRPRGARSDAAASPPLCS